MSAAVYDLPRVTAALDDIATGLELVLHSRFPDLAGRTRVVLTLVQGGVEVHLRTLALTDAQIAELRSCLDEITGATQPRDAIAPEPTGHESVESTARRDRRRPPQPRVRDRAPALRGEAVVSLGKRRRAS